MKRLQLKSKIVKFFILTFLLCSSTCKKDEYSEVPYAYVELELNIYNELAIVGVGQFVVIKPAATYGQISIYDPYQNVTYPAVGGKFTGKGIILYHYSPDEWHAYDNTCTYKPQTDNAEVVTYKDSMYFICPKCKSHFLILDGTPAKGSPAPRPLKQYRTIIDGYSNLLITN
jgi:nitrite reductase/ring-hydroxylating ferredoxin subunit